MASDLHQLTLPGAMLRRGFWLYVWKITGPSGTALYVGRTGDNSSPHASAPYTRMGQHLGSAKTQNALRRHLETRGWTDFDSLTFDLFSHGPIYPEVDHDGADRSTLMARHMPLRDQVGAMEKLLCDGLRVAGYDVMNTVNCKWTLDTVGTEKWEIAKAAFRKEFPEL
ncbi:hypothetical protein [Pararhodobacter oceanensis]|uniref:hypothetical protein n=1 Tax=Pararhodobacter oceanensis TaxID=2172121 RepID=UPI003A8F19B2